MDKFIFLILVLIVVIALGAQLYSYIYTEEGFIGGDLRPGDYISRFFPARGDIGEYDEEVGFRRDNRYFAGYTDVQRIGIDHDFCRMVEPEGNSDPKNAFFACALAATEQLSGTSYRTETVAEGFKRSRDDYMRDTGSSGRMDYCRIIRSPSGDFQPLCRRAMDRRFGKKDVVDPKPPAAIATLLNFYDGIMMWLRMRDDLVDYAQNLLVSRGGDIKIDETPWRTPGRDPRSQALTFNGIDHFLRLGENRSLEFGDQNINMRGARAISFWVYFDEFTNNAHIFDFGNGAGKDNVFCGIVGRGNASISKSAIRDLLCGDNETLPLGPSGQQPVYSDGFAAIPNGCMETAEGGSTAKGFTDGAPVMTPQKMMQTTAGNVNEWDSKGFEIVGRRMKPLQPKALATGSPVSADILYEVWDGSQRKMQIKVPDAVRLREWTHIAITAETNDAFRPDIAVYVNGRKATMKPSGFLPQTNYMTHNYIGKSNWSSATSQYENRDELFKGRLFDFRVYNNQMGFTKIMDTIRWGSEILGIDAPGEGKAGRSSKYMQDVMPVGALTSFADIDKERFAIGDTTNPITTLEGGLNKPMRMPI